MPKARTVNAGTKFIIRGIARQHVGGHRETFCVAEAEPRQRGTPRETGRGVLERGSAVRGS